MKYTINKGEEIIYQIKSLYNHIKSSLYQIMDCNLIYDLKY